MRTLAQYVDQIPSLTPRPHFWNEVERGHHALWSFGPEEDCRGVVVFSRREGDDGPQLWVEISSETGYAFRNRQKILQKLDAIALRFGCTSIVFETTRLEWERVAPALGFERLGTVTRYERKVANGR